MTDFEELRGALGDDFKPASEAKTERVSTGNYALDRALGGGMAYGAMVVLHGSEGSGKTSVALSTVANAQAEGKTCIWFDTENGFDPEWAERHGVDTDELLIQRNRASAKIFDSAIKALKAGVDLMVFDSINGMIPRGHMDGDSDEVKGMTESTRLGSLASDMSEGLPKLFYYNDDNRCLMLFISQERNKNYGTHWAPGPSGGKSTDYFNGQQIRLLAGTGKKAFIKKKVKSGDKLVEKKVGRHVTYRIMKNRYGPPFRGGNFDFYFDGDFIGPDNAGAVLDAAVEQGVINKAGAWYKYQDDVIAQGRENAADTLREDVELLEEIKGQLDG